MCPHCCELPGSGCELRLGRHQCMSGVSKAYGKQRANFWCLNSSLGFLALADLRGSDLLSPGRAPSGAGRRLQLIGACRVSRAVVVAAVAILCVCWGLASKRLAGERRTPKYLQKVGTCGRGNVPPI